MEILEVFSTPICMRPLEDVDALNAELTAVLVAESQAHPGIQRSNLGGWHSVPDLTLRRTAPFPAFFQRMVAELEATLRTLAARRDLAPARYRYGIQAWAMVMRSGDYTVLHDHAESHLSAVYYADAGDEVEGPSAQLAFARPGGGFAEIPGLPLFPTTCLVRPRTGLLVLFPGYLQHYVHPYRGQRPRVAISFNVRAEAMAPPSP